MESCLLWEGHHAGAGKGCEESSLEEVEEAKTMCDEPTSAPMSCPTLLLRHQKKLKTVSEVEPWKKGGVVERYFKISFLLLITLLLFDRVG